MKKISTLFLMLSLASCKIIAPPLGNPSVVSSTPVNGTQDVAPGAAVKLELTPAEISALDEVSGWKRLRTEEEA